MARLVDDLLDVSRITRGNIELKKTRTLLAAVTESAIEASRPGIEAAGHALSVSLPDEPVEIEVDGTRMSQVIQNLLNNAVKFTPPGGEIRISAEASADEVVIVVRDSGIGMAPESIGEIFEMFSPGEQRPRPRQRPGHRVGAGEGAGGAARRQHQRIQRRDWQGKRVSDHHPAGPAARGRCKGSRRRELRCRAWALATGAAPASCSSMTNQDAVEMLAAYLRLKGYDVRTALRRPRCARARRGVRRGCRGARYRASRHERIRTGPAAEVRMARPAADHPGADRLGPARGQATREGGGLRSSLHQADRPRGAPGSAMRPGTSLQKIEQGL
jgi:hypothetical protein